MDEEIIETLACAASLEKKLHKETCHSIADFFVGRDFETSISNAAEWMGNQIAQCVDNEHDVKIYAAAVSVLINRAATRCLLAMEREKHGLQ